MGVGDAAGGWVWGQPLFDLRIGEWFRFSGAVRPFHAIPGSSPSPL